MNGVYRDDRYEKNSPKVVSGGYLIYSHSYRTDSVESLVGVQEKVNSLGLVFELEIGSITNKHVPISNSVKPTYILHIYLAELTRVDLDNLGKGDN